MSRSPLKDLICPALCALGLFAGGAPVWSEQPQPVQSFINEHVARFLESGVGSVAH